MDEAESGISRRTDFCYHRADMDVPQITIPNGLSAEARQLVQEVNDLLKLVIFEVACVNADPEAYSDMQRRRVADQCEYALAKFKQMRHELRSYGLEWTSDWPDQIEDK